MIISRYTAPVLLSALLFAAAGSAAAESGLTGAPILNRPVGARSSAMGRAFTAVPGDPEALLYNPAGLAFVEGFSPHVSYMNGFSGGSYGFLAAPVKFRNFVLTPAYHYYNSGTISLNLTDGTVGSVTAELDQVALLSAAYRPAPGLALGATLKRLDIDLAETASADALSVDVGALYRLNSSLSFGAAVLNTGQEIKFEEDADPSPRALRAGVAYKMVPRKPNFMDPSADISYSDLLFTADWSKVIKEDSYFQTGLEVNMLLPQSILLSLRAGYLFDREEEGLTFGFGFKSGRWTFAFGFETPKKLDARRPVSVSYDF